MYWVCFIEWYNEDNIFRSLVEVRFGKLASSQQILYFWFVRCVLCAWHSLTRLFLSSDKRSTEAGGGHWIRKVPRNRKTTKSFVMQKRSEQGALDVLISGIFLSGGLAPVLSHLVLIFYSQMFKCFKCSNVHSRFRLLWSMIFASYLISGTFPS